MGMGLDRVLKLIKRNGYGLYWAQAQWKWINFIPVKVLHNNLTFSSNKTFS
jgi:hypothetical protein